MEDKDDLFKNLSFISPRKSKILESSPIHISSSSTHTPSAPALSPKTTGTWTPSVVCPLQIYTQREKPIILPVQVPDSELIPETETNETVLKEQNILPETETDGIVLEEQNLPSLPSIISENDL